MEGGRGRSVCDLPAHPNEYIKASLRDLAVPPELGHYGGGGGGGGGESLFSHADGRQ